MYGKTRANSCIHSALQVSCCTNPCPPCSLPMESARKLRWYADNKDLAAIVRTHLREKRELEDTLAALKKVVWPAMRASGSWAVHAAAFACPPNAGPAASRHRAG